MPAKSSHYWLIGVLGALSLASVLWTFRDGDISPSLVLERDVESQRSIDSLSHDMSRLMQSISNWQSFCEDPYAYIKSASVHGNFQIAVKDPMNREEILALSQIERDALARCAYTKNHPQSAQFRLCLSVKETAASQPRTSWFDDNHLFEMNFEFREGGSKLLTHCSDIQKSRVEVQSYFSAYTADGEIMDIRRISGGVRVPLENGGRGVF
ncbi:MAG: hypothetical protein H7249_19735 [Chitinophagaceae bacterium]|nr:hypothetical protein [Oligoflexus sp.]